MVLNIYYLNQWIWVFRLLNICWVVIFLGKYTWSCRGDYSRKWICPEILIMKETWRPVEATLSRAHPWDKFPSSEKFKGKVMAVSWLEKPASLVAICLWWNFEGWKSKWPSRKQKSFLLWKLFGSSYLALNNWFWLVFNVRCVFNFLF